MGHKNRSCVYGRLFLLNFESLLSPGLHNPEGRSPSTSFGFSELLMTFALDGGVKRGFVAFSSILCADLETIARILLGAGLCYHLPWEIHSPIHIMQPDFKKKGKKSKKIKKSARLFIEVNE